MADHPEPLAEVVTAGDTIPADWLDLRSWAVGYCAGYDQGAVRAVHRTRLELAEALVELDRGSWVPAARELREQRLAREEARCAASALPPVQTADWPEITTPGTGGKEEGRA